MTARFAPSRPGRRRGTAARVAFALGLLLAAQCTDDTSDVTNVADGQDDDTRGDQGASRDAAAPSSVPRPAEPTGDAAPATPPAADSTPQTPILQIGDECVVDEDCPLYRPHCCGCDEEFGCVLGKCESTGQWCADSACCFTPLGCDAACAVDSPYTDYDGSCDGVTCADIVAELDYRYRDAFEIAACCTTGSDDSLSEPGEHCGVDASLLGGIMPGYCVQIVRPGSIDAECQPGTDPHTGVVGEGCCTSAGRCGVMTEGFGCLDQGFGAACNPADAGP